MRTHVLDHGYVEFIESWGSDERIVEAARMSTGKGFLGWGPKPFCKHCSKEPPSLYRPEDARLEEMACSGCWRSDGIELRSGDEKLLRYLWEHKHATPFEMAGMIIEVQAPIFVFREWHRHRTQSYNELSARYTPMPNLAYTPTTDRLLNRDPGQAGHPQNKQAGTIKGAAVLDEDNALLFQERLAKLYEDAEDLYQWALLAGVPKELARLPVPVARYSRMRASANLRNWLAFLTLRMDAAAQQEIRWYAEIVGELIREKFPKTWALFIEGRNV